MMTPRELADALENIDEEAFASLLLEFELNHDDGPKQVKTMIIDALRFSDQHGLKASRPPLDEAVDPAKVEDMKRSRGLSSRRGPFAAFD
jgi:hypothetical protein